MILVSVWVQGPRHRVLLPRLDLRDSDVNLLGGVALVGDGETTSQLAMGSKGVSRHSGHLLERHEQCREKAKILDRSQSLCFENSGGGVETLSGCCKPLAVP